MGVERFGNFGYMGLIKQTDPFTPLIPTDYIPLYEESLTTDVNLQDLKPAYGNRFATFTTIPGIRKHRGDVTVLGEPNTIARLFDMTLVKGTTTGSNPYTHPFTLSNTANPNPYTIDISTGNVVKRFWGVQASSINPNWNDNEAQMKLAVSALGSFQGREIASVTGTGPYTIVLKTDYDTNPTLGLKVGDLIRFFDVATNASVCDTTVTAVTNATTFTCTTIVSGAMTAVGAGDFVHLRPATTSFNTLQPFTWTKTEFHFGATASAALAAAQTRVEQSSTWGVMFGFESEDGAPRSGGKDPASLVRTTGNYDLTVKKFFDTPEDVILLNNLAQTACVVRMFSGGSNEYELRLTFNALITDNPLPNIKAQDVNYSTIKYHPNYNQTDGQAFDVKVINALASV